VNKEVKPYQEDGGKKDQVSKMFNRIAPHYDFLNRLLSLGIDTYWRKRAIDQLVDQHPQRVLDVATGTADVALAISRRLQPQHVTGVDISTRMLDKGREKIRKQGKSEIISLEEGDSENLPYADNSFDAITVAFGVRNFEDLEKGLSEMQRVLQPEGKLVVLEFSRPRIFPFKQLFNGYFKYILPAIGRLTSKDPKAYRDLYESVQAFPDGNDLLSILHKKGYKTSKCIPLTLGICSIYTAHK